MAGTFILGTYRVACSPPNPALEICAKSWVFSDDPVLNQFHLEPPIGNFGARAPNPGPVERPHMAIMSRHIRHVYCLNVWDGVKSFLSLPFLFAGRQRTGSSTNKATGWMPRERILGCRVQGEKFLLKPPSIERLEKPRPWLPLVQSPQASVETSRRG